MTPSGIQLIFILLLLSLSAAAQNLVPNPGFEDVNVCLTYKEECSPQAWRNVELKGFQFPEIIVPKKSGLKTYDGIRAARISVFNKRRTFDRVFIQTPLLCELEADKAYRLSFHYLLEAETVTKLGVQVLDTISIIDKNWIFRDCVHDMEVPLNPKKHLVWQKAEVEYIAKGGEQAILIGNFKSDGNTKLALVKKKEKKDVYPSRIMLWLDGFSLEALDGSPPCSKIEENRIAIYRDSARHFHRPISLVRDIERKRRILLEKQEEEIATEISEEQIIVADTPLISTQTAIIEKTPFILEDINFESNSATLLAEAFKPLDELYMYLSKNPKTTISIIGHTDNVGAEKTNLILSRRRAETVAAVLIEKGISPDRIISQGKGESSPITTNDTPEGRQRNRRVEFLLK